MLGSLALAGMIWTSTSKQLDQDAATAQFNPLETREDHLRPDARSVGARSRSSAKGLRYWNDVNVQRANGYGVTEPHNLVISALGESGIVGAADVLALNGVLVFGLRKRRDPLGQAAFYLVIARFVAGLADIYWVAGAGTLPWLVRGSGGHSRSSGPEPPRWSSPDRLSSPRIEPASSRPCVRFPDRAARARRRFRRSGIGGAPEVATARCQTGAPWTR